MKSNIPPSIVTPKRIILALGETMHSRWPYRLLSRMGWDIIDANSGPTVCKLIKSCNTSLIFIDTELDDESGWLTCAKLTMVNSQLQIVLLAPKVDEYEEHFAAVVGATMILPYDTDILSVLYDLWPRKRLPGISWN